MGGGKGQGPQDGTLGTIGQHSRDPGVCLRHSTIN